ncbi:MAG: tRNA pseudouridine(13) synthase TruD [Natrialbaceae archaeon]|nr:tRNA pseudouridine(13) synthase TruD [Natrialbaceae archaeon]
MQPAHPTEQAVGMDYYVSDTSGIGGRLKHDVEAFRVRELEAVDAEPLGADPGAYSHLVVRATLAGWDTNEFATRLSNAIGISRERVRWAGTKDAAARTTQLLSIKGITAADLPEMSDADLEPVGRLGRGLTYGDLAGNEFSITVADSTHPERIDAITDELAALGGAPDRIGVPNYFGQQRFGSRRPITHEVGLAIVRDDWQGAVETYVGDAYEDEPAATRRAREHFADTGDPASTLDQFPSHLRHERALLHALTEVDGTPEPSDYRAALERLPSSLQQLFVHAAQSYIFNRIVSERLERGLPLTDPVVGDVVCSPDLTIVPRPARPDRQQVVDERNLEAVRRHCERERAFVTAPLLGPRPPSARASRDHRAIGPRDAGTDAAAFEGPGEFGSRGTRRSILLRTAIEFERDPVRATFALPPGSYATVVLREYCKVDPAEMA